MNHGTPRCSLCGEGHDRVNLLIGGLHGFICDECVDGSAAIIRARRLPPSPMLERMALAILRRAGLDEESVALIKAEAGPHWSGALEDARSIGAAMRFDNAADAEAARYVAREAGRDAVACIAILNVWIDALGRIYD